MDVLTLFSPLFQGQYNYGSEPDPWVNGNTSGAIPTTTPFPNPPGFPIHNNNAYFVQVSKDHESDGLINFAESRSIGLCNMH
jgi:hypothetical protein